MALADLAGTDSDATAAIQAAIDAGTAIPPGVFRIESPLTIAGGNRLVGAGPNLTVLEDHGSDQANGIIRIPNGSHGYRIDGIQLAKAGTTKTGVGIREGYVGTGGNQSSASLWQQVWVIGYDVGYYSGDSGTGQASSEGVYMGCKFGECNTGVKLEAFNTFCLTFINVGLSLCGIGIQTNETGCTTVVGGSASNTDLVFDVGTDFTVRDYRAEACAMFLSHGNNPATQAILIDHCRLTANPTSDKVEVELFAGACATIRDTLMDGYVKYSVGGDDIDPGYGTIVLDRVQTKYEKLLQGVGGGRCRYETRGCTLVDENFITLSRVPNYRRLLRNTTVQ